MLTAGEKHVLVKKLMTKYIPLTTYIVLMGSL